MPDTRIIERVRKMLALANDSAASEGERENALRMAHATLAKHNIDMAAVGNSQPQEERGQQVKRMSVYPYARGIAHAIAGLFFCRYYFCRDTGASAMHYFIGKQSNAITASEMTDYILGNLFKELRQRYGSVSAPKARAFATGVEAAIRARCWALQQAASAEATTDAPGTALVLANLYKTEDAENGAWLDACVGKIKVLEDRTKPVTPDAYRSGIAHGKTISLNNQIGAAKSATLRLK